MSFWEHADRELQCILEGETSEELVITYNGTEYTIRGLYDKHFETIDPGTLAPVLSQHPRIIIFDGLGFTPNKNDEVKISGETWYVKYHDTDGKKALVIELKKYRDDE